MIHYTVTNIKPIPNSRNKDCTYFLITSFIKCDDGTSELCFIADVENEEIKSLGLYDALNNWVDEYFWQWVGGDTLAENYALFETSASTISAYFMHAI